MAPAAGLLKTSASKIETVVVAKIQCSFHLYITFDSSRSQKSHEVEEGAQGPDLFLSNYVHSISQEIVFSRQARISNKD